jgi:hypothetical protein
MNLKPRPNHLLYLEALRSMSVDQKLLKTCELSELGKAVLREGVRQRFPEATEEELHRVFLDRLARCHNWNY